MQNKTQNIVGSRKLVESEVARIMREYGITTEEAEIAAERQKVYGDPKINHDGIAQAWAGLLQPFALHIAEMKPIPPHLVALMMAALKMNRMRMIFHDDNFDDLNVYMAFARAWQKTDASQTVVIGPRPSPTARLVIRWEEPDSMTQ